MNRGRTDYIGELRKQAAEATTSGYNAEVSGDTAAARRAFGEALFAMTALKETAYTDLNDVSELNDQLERLRYSLVRRIDPDTAGEQWYLETAIRDGFEILGPSGTEERTLLERAHYVQDADYHTSPTLSEAITESDILARYLGDRVEEIRTHLSQESATRYPSFERKLRTEGNVHALETIPHPEGREPREGPTWSEAINRRTQRPEEHSEQSLRRIDGWEETINKLEELDVERELSEPQSADTAPTKEMSPEEPSLGHPSPGSESIATPSAALAGHSESPEEPTGPQPNELAEYVEAFTTLESLQKALIERFDDDLPQEHRLRQWHAVIENFIYVDGPDSQPCYMEQQYQRNPLAIGAYREAFGDGERITDYSAITAAPPPEAVLEDLEGAKLVAEAEALAIPVAPESMVRLPVIVVTDTEFSEARDLLREFPETPAADPGANNSDNVSTDSQGEEIPDSGQGGVKPSTPVPPDGKNETDRPILHDILDAFDEVG